MSKRFYKQVSIAALDGERTIQLDGRTLKTPGKHILRLPSAHIANCVAREWEAQGDTVDPRTMPCTRLCNVAVEQTPKRRDELTAEFCKYLSTDLLCYRASHPADLVQAQREAWDPVLDWAASRGIGLVTTTGLNAVDQPASTFKTAAHLAVALDDIDMTLLLHFTASFGSAVLALAVMEGHMSIEQAFAASRVDEDHQAQRWGADDEAAANALALKAELTALAQLIKE